MCFDLVVMNMLLVFVRVLWLEFPVGLLLRTFEQVLELLSASTDLVFGYVLAHISISILIFNHSIFGSTVVMQ